MKLFRTTVAVAALMAALTSADAALAARAYIGTYTTIRRDARRQQLGNGEGIYLVDVDDATGAPSHAQAGGQDPVAVLDHAVGGPQVSLCGERDRHLWRQQEGSVTAFAVDPGDRRAQAAQHGGFSGGSIPCFISIHPCGKFLLVANYTGGSYEVIRLKPDGSLGEITDVVKPAGPMSVYKAADRPPGMFGDTEPHGSRGHMILPDPSGQYVVGADAGRDQIFVWKLDANTGKLNQVSVTKSVAGAAPRHFAFSPDGKTLYQQQEQDSRLTVYGFADGKLTQKGPSISTLPDGFQGSNTTSELLIDKAGKHLYGANRNHDSIATMAVHGRWQRQADRQHPYRRHHPAQPDARSRPASSSIR